MKKVRLTSHTLALSTSITLCCSQIVQHEGDAKRNASKSHRGKKTETGGSDPTFLASSRPKSSWGRSRPRRSWRRSFFHGDAPYKNRFIEPQGEKNTVGADNASKADHFRCLIVRSN